MNRKLFVITLVSLLTVGCMIAGALAQETEVQDTAEIAGPVGTVFTYQGRLTMDGAPTGAPHGLEFRLFETAVGNTPVGTPIRREIDPLDDGLFTVQLNFGSSAFNGEARWLEIAVRGSTGTYTTLSPRQQLTPVPYALALPSVVPIGSAIRFGPLDNFIDLFWEGTKFSIRNPASEKLLTLSQVDGHLWVNGVKPVRIHRFENIGNDGDIDTGIPESEYFCVAAGWSTHYNIKSGGDHNNMVWTYVQGSTWRVRVSFASQFNDENPDVDVVCFRREIAAWDSSGAPTTLNDPD